MDTSPEMHKEQLLVHPCYIFLTLHLHIPTCLQSKGSTFSFCPASTSYQGKERRVDPISSWFLQAVTSYKGLDNHSTSLFETVVRSSPITCDSYHITLQLFGTFYCLLYSLFFTCRCLAPPCPSYLASCSVIINNLPLLPKPTQPALSCCRDESEVAGRWLCHPPTLFSADGLPVQARSFTATVTEPMTQDLNKDTCSLPVIQEYGMDGAVQQLNFPHLSAERSNSKM